MPHRIRRRDFLILGSTGVAYSVLGGGPMAGPGEERADLAPMAVGYWQGRNEGDAAPDDGRFRADVTDAARLRTGDRKFLSTGARVTIHGVVESGRRWPHAELNALSVFACFDVDGQAGRETVRHHVWDLGKEPVVNRSAAVSFTVPVLEGTGLRLSVRRFEEMPSPVGRYVRSRVHGVHSSRATERASLQDVVLSVDPEPGSPALRRGVYFLAGLAHGSAAPRSWRGLQFHAADEAGEVNDRRLVRRGVCEPVPAEFDYLVVSVDHAA